MVFFVVLGVGVGIAIGFDLFGFEFVSVLGFGADGGGVTLGTDGSFEVVLGDCRIGGAWRAVWIGEETADAAVRVGLGQRGEDGRGRFSLWGLIFRRVKKHRGQKQGG